MAQPKARINLYSPALGGSRPRGAGKQWWMLGGALLALVFAAGMVFQLAERWKVTRAIAAKEAALDQLRRDQQLLDDKLGLLTSGLSTQVTSASAELIEVINRRLPWVELFQEMSVRVPEGVWLLRVEIEVINPPKGREGTRVAEKRSVVLAGFARSHQNVGRLLSALEQSPKFTAVSLKFAEQAAGKGGQQVDFEINGQLL